MVVNSIQNLATRFGIDWRQGAVGLFRSANATPQLPGQLTAGPSEVCATPAPTFVRRHYYLSPARMFRFLYGMLTSVRSQLEIYRLMKTAAYAQFVRTDPRFRFKFLIRDYLVRGFSPVERTACFLQHYKRLHAGTSADLLHQLLYQSVNVLYAERNGVDLEIGLCFSRPFEKEGELSFSLSVDGAAVFVLSFTIVPGWVVQSEAKEVLLLTRLQGTNGFYPQIRAATKAMHDVAPAAILLAALHGFARAFGIAEMAGVSAVRQSSFTEEMSEFYRSAYDGFFTEIGALENAAGFFLSPLPPVDRPMSAVKQGHKIRTRKKRECKRQVAEDVYLSLRKGMNGETPLDCRCPPEQHALNSTPAPVL